MALNWAHAMAQGGAAMAGAGADMADQQIKEDAEMRAADRKLELAERIAATQEAMKNRAAERFSAVMKQKAGEQVPVDAPGVAQTGLSAGSAQSIGLQDGIQGDTGVVNDIIQRAGAVLNDPNATAEQKQQATELIQQISGQAKAQGDINAKSVEGQTRKRTMAEAGKAALEETLMTDPAAYMAGKGMLYDKADIEEAKLSAQLQREELRQDRLDKRNREDNDSRERAAEIRAETLLKRATEKKDDPYKYLGELGKEIRSNNTLINSRRRELIAARKDGDDELAKTIQDEISQLEATNKQLSAGSRTFAKSAGIAVPDELMQTEGPAKPATPKIIPALPAGAKQIGTSGGRPVYQTPDGKKFIAQ